MNEKAGRALRSTSKQSREPCRGAIPITKVYLCVRCIIHSSSGHESWLVKNKRNLFVCKLDVTKNIILWTIGSGDDSALGHKYRNNRLVPTHIEAPSLATPRSSLLPVGSRTLQRWQRKAPSTPGAKHQASGTPMPRRRQSGCPRASPIAYCRALTSGAATICHLCTPSLLPWARISRLDSCATTTAMTAGGSNQRRLQRQQGKTPASAEKGKDCEYVTSMTMYGRISWNSRAFQR